MGAKKKPQETLVARRPRRRRRRAPARRARGPRCSRSATPPPRGETRKIEDDGSAAAGDRRLPRGEAARCEDARLPRAPRRRARRRASLGVLAKAASLGGDVAAVRRRLGRARARGRGRRVRRGDASTSPTTRALEAPLPQPRVDVLAQLVARRAASTPCSSRLRARRRRRRRARRAARRRAELGSRRPRAARTASSSARARRSATRCYVDVGWTGRAAASRSSARARSSPAETGGDAPRSTTSPVAARGLLDARRRWSSRRTRRARGRRSRTRT